MSSNLTLDVTGLTVAGIGHSGISPAELEARSERAADAVAVTLERRRKGEIGFLDLPDDRATARACMDFARALPPEIDTMVVLGIGGSSLGPRALYSALARPFDALRPRAPGMPRRLFFPDNVDPVTMRGLLEVVDPERTVWNVVTKSGGTAETAAQLLVIDEWLQDKLGPERAQRHLVATTDPAKGALRKTATARGWRTFAVPPNVGGRFSVLSPVGLLPAAVAGLDVAGLLDGARRMRDRCVAPDLDDNPALRLATLLHWHHVERGRPIVVLMSYVDALFDTADWFRQLWAESLGKDGQGPTPVAARGATDQHSQLQLYAEGAIDKVVLFLTATSRGEDVRLPASDLAASQPDYAYLAGKGMGELLDAELRGTMGSLQRRGRPFGLLALPRVDAPALGELLMLLEAATAFAGPIYGVDPYDQPGVEEAKRLAYAALGREGFQDQMVEVRSDPRHVV